MLKRERAALASGAGEGSRTSKRRKEEGGTSSDVDMGTTDAAGAEDVEAEEDVKERGLRLWQTVKDAVNTDGRHLSLNFLRQPSKRQYPDYYQFIQHPIALEDIRKKLDLGAYPTLEAVRQDFELCFNNAKLYNRPESDIYSDAKELLKLTNKTIRKLLPADENGEHVKTPSMKRSLSSRLQKLISKTDDSGRVLSSEFMELPSRKLWPYYYSEIQKPQCLDNIQKHVKKKEYASVEEFAADVELVFSNAMSFNQEHTQIWEDALALRDHFRVLMSDLPPPFALPQYAKPSKNKIKIKMPASQSTASAKVEESHPPTISLRVPAPSKPAANTAATQATQAAPVVPPTSASPDVATSTPVPAAPPPLPAKPVPVQTTTVSTSQPPVQPRPYTNISFIQKPQPSYTPPTPVPAISPAPAPSPFVSTHRLEVAKVASTSNSPAPPAVPVHQLKSIQLITEPRGRPLRLDARDGVKSWAMRLERDERSVSVQNVVFEDEDDDSSGEEEEEEEAEMEIDAHAKPGPGRKKKRGRGRPPKVPKAPAPKPKTSMPKKKIKKIGEIQVKLNGAVMKEREEASGKWTLDLTTGNNVLEVGEKGGLIWKVYAERIG